MSKYMTIPKTKEAIKTMGLKVAPTMACPIKENTNTCRDKMEVVIISVMEPYTPKYVAMNEFPNHRHDAPNNHKGVISASPIASS